VFHINVIAVEENIFSGVEHTSLSQYFSYLLSTIIRVCFKAEI